MIFGDMLTTYNKPVRIAVEFIQDGKSYIRIGEYTFPLDTFVNSLIFDYAGEASIVGYLNRNNRNKSGKVYELRKPKVQGRVGSGTQRRPIRGDSILRAGGP